MPSLVKPVDASDSETFRALCDLARKKTGVIPSEVIAGHVLTITQGADWAVRLAAMEAIIRRHVAMQQTELRVAVRPSGQLPGFFVTHSRGDRRPYETLVWSWNPIQASCNCADFQHNSLGLCKHVLAAVSDCVRRPVKHSAKSPSVTPRLAWNPIRPLTGPGDWLARLEWTSDQAPVGLRRTLAGLKDAKDPGDRLKVVRGLRRFLESARPDEFDPVLPPLARAEEERLLLRVEGEALATQLPTLLRGLKHKLYPYQRAGLVRAVSAGRLLLADDMGLGKTIQAVAFCHVLWNARKVRRGLLIVPASLKSQWQHEWSSFTDTPIRIVEGLPADRAAIYRETSRGFLIANYEQVMRDLRLMQDWDPQLVVLDEAQRIKNWETKTSGAVKALRPRFRLVLTGTPMENRLDELASIMDWVDDHALEPKWRIVPWHTQTADGSREAIGARNLDTLRDRLGSHMLRRRRAEVLTDLPSRTDTRVPVEMTQEQLEAHGELDPPILRLVAIARKRPLTQPQFLQLMTLLAQQRMICNGLALAEFEDVAPDLERMQPTDKRLASLFAPKLRELRELVSNVVLTQERKVIIFSQWRRMLVLAQWAVSDLLAKARVKSVFFSGQENLKRRTQNIVDLHDDPQTRILFATDAGGVGLNLQRAATCCINLELPWNPAVLEQRIGRIHRNGQKHPVEVFNLVSNGGIEARIADLVADKRALFAGLFDGTTDEIRFEGSGSFLSRVEKLVVEQPATVGPAASSEPLSSPEQEEAESDATLDAPPPPVVVEPPAPAPALIAPPGDIRSLLSELRVQRAADGGLSISAPPAAAASLAALFGELARKLTEAAQSE